MGVTLSVTPPLVSKHTYTSFFRNTAGVRYHYQKNDNDSLIHNFGCTFVVKFGINETVHNGRGDLAPTLSGLRYRCMG